MTVLCPRCGGLFSRQEPRGAFSDQELYHPEDLFLMGCLCYYDRVSLERVFGNFEERFKSILAERFPGKKLSDIPPELGKMERHSPLRVSLVKKFEIYRRVKDRMKVLQEEESKKEREEEERGDLIERSIGGKSLSIHDWLQSLKR